MVSNWEIRLLFKWAFHDSFSKACVFLDPCIYCKKFVVGPKLLVIINRKTYIASSM